MCARQQAPKSKSDYENMANQAQNEPNYKDPIAWGIGVRRSKKGKTLDVWYPSVFYQSKLCEAAVFHLLSGFTHFENGTIALEAQKAEDLLDWIQYSEDSMLVNLLKMVHSKSSPESYSQVDIVVTFLYDGSVAVASAEEAYFKLHLLSNRLIKPHEMSLDGAFGQLTNVAWTSLGPILPEDLDEVRLQSLNHHALIVTHVDKFPYLVNYHIPSGVRIASGSQVRLGAYLGEGTTVMPAGYINFNAGTAGHAMIEGRVSAGVFVGDKSDVGGGASIMGTLSGGNDRVISIGDQCLLGANSGTGISLGRGCTIAAGLYVTAGMKIRLLNADDEPINLQGVGVDEGQNIVKAAEVSGRDYLLFYQDSRTGYVLCKPNKKIIELNEQLHQN